MGKQWKQWQFIFLGSKITADGDCSHEFKEVCSLEEKLWPTYAKSLQSCPTLCDPIDGSSPGSPVPGILQARTLEWVAISFSNAWGEKWKWSRSVVSDPQWPHGLQPTRVLHPWDFPGKNTGVGCHFLHRYSGLECKSKKSRDTWSNS